MGLYVILMGVQGAGKGEQARFIRETYGIPHISTGDLFRAMKTREDELAKRVQTIMAAGNLVDDATTNEVVKDRLSQPDAQKGVIFDGYPRTPAQADWLDQYLTGQGERVNIVVLLELDLYTAFKRAFGRVTHPQTGQSYNIYYNADALKEWAFVPAPDNFPPRLRAVAQDGVELTRRPDDGNADAVLKRIDIYIKTTQPLIEYYEAKKLLRRINADQPITMVSEAIKAAVEQAAS